MKSASQVAREISYAHSARTRGGRALIRAMENATGRIGLIRQARGYEVDLADGGSFWTVMAARYGLSLKVIAGSFESIPRSGPLLLVANHPYGILDGLMMGLILSQRRDDFRILAHQVFRKAQDLEEVILPISFDETRDATKLNLSTRRAALDHLDRHGAIGIFPGGTVSTSAKMFSQPMDPGWRSFTARMIARSPATVVPVYFSGHNSRLFQLASHLHNTLRMGLLIKEFRSRVNKPVEVAIGQPISRADLAPFASEPRAMMDFLRQETYRLSPTPLKSIDYGFEFEDRYKH